MRQGRTNQQTKICIFRLLAISSFYLWTFVQLIFLFDWPLSQEGQKHGPIRRIYHYDNMYELIYSLSVKMHLVGRVTEDAHNLWYGRTFYIRQCNRPTWDVTQGRSREPVERDGTSSESDVLCTAKTNTHARATAPTNTSTRIPHTYDQI